MRLFLILVSIDDADFMRETTENRKIKNERILMKFIRENYCVDTHIHGNMQLKKKRERRITIMNKTNKKKIMK